MSPYDNTLFEGTASYYRKYRARYDPAFVDVLTHELGLDGTGRLLDVGCGTGFVVLPLAGKFEQAVGLDPDQGMLDEAAAEAAERGIDNARWVRASAEQLPELDLGQFRLITMAQAFHWMDRPRVLRNLFDSLTEHGAVVILDNTNNADPDLDTAPWMDLEKLIAEYLGPQRRAGSGVFVDPGPPTTPFEGSVFGPLEHHRVPNTVRDSRTVDDVLGFLFSTSYAARRLFGDRIDDFEKDARQLLNERSPSGLFPFTQPDLEINIFRKPALP